MLTPVVSLPVPAVVGIAISGLSGPGHGQALADRRVHVVEEVGRRIGRVEVDGLGGVDRRAAADGDDAVELVARAAKAIASWNDSSVGSTRTRS